LVAFVCEDDCTGVVLARERGVGPSSVAVNVWCGID